MCVCLTRGSSICVSFRDAFVFVTFIAAIVRAFPSRRVFVCLGSYFYLCLVVRVFACVFRHASLQRECFDKQRRGVKCLFEHMLESLLRAARLSAAIQSASGDTQGAARLTLSLTLIYFVIPPLFSTIHHLPRLALCHINISPLPH